MARLVVRLHQVGEAGSLGPSGCALVPGRSARRVFRRRRASIAGESRSDPRSCVNSPRLRAAELCSVRFMVIKPSRPSRARAKREHEDPRAFRHIGTRPPGRWGNARRSTATGPAVKTSNPRLSPRGARSAVGGIRARAQNPGRRASSCSTLLRLHALCEPQLKGLLELVRGLRLIRRQAVADGSHGAGQRAMSETAT